MYFTIKTDTEVAEIAIIDNTGHQIHQIAWRAHRELSDTIFIKIDELFSIAKIDWSDINGIACFSGPGSFTGLRIGHSVANAIAYSESIPITSCGGENWAEECIKALKTGRDQKIIIPNYGGEANISRPKK